MNKKNYTPKGFIAKGEIDPKKKLRESLLSIIILPIFLFVIILFLFDKEQIFFSFKDSIVEIFESNNFFKVLASLIFILIIL